jgi:hypothetical protein
MTAEVFRPIEKKKSLQEAKSDWEKEHKEVERKLCDEEWLYLIYLEE